MATLYGNQYSNAFVVNPSVKIPPGDQNGVVRRMYFDYTITATSTANDIIKLGQLPKGARVYDACLSFPDLGTTGVLELGWAASVETSGGSALEAADDNGFLASVDVNAAANTVNMIEVSGAAVPGLMKDFTAAVDVQILVTTAWTVTSGTIKGYIEYIVE
jgi:hypothetical protein